MVATVTHRACASSELNTVATVTHRACARSIIIEGDGVSAVLLKMRRWVDTRPGLCVRVCVCVCVCVCPAHLSDFVFPTDM